MITFSRSTLIGKIIRKTGWIVTSISNSFFPLIRLEKFKSSLWFKKYKQLTEWMWIVWMVLKSVRGDGVGKPKKRIVSRIMAWNNEADRENAIYRIILNYFMNCANTPRNIWIGFFRLVYVDKPEDLQIVLNNSSTLEKSGIYNFFKKVLGEGLITAPVSKWKRNRRLIYPLFGTRFVKSYFDIFNSKSTELCQNLRKFCDTEEHFDLWIPVSKTTLAMIWDVVIGTDSDISENEKETIIKASAKTTEAFGLRIYRIWLYPVLMFRLFVAIYNYSKYFDVATSLPNRILSRKKEMFKRKSLQMKQKNNDSIKLSYMDQFLKLNEEGATFSDKEIIYEGNTLLGAGSETNALTISFALIMLAMNPQIQEKVYQEVLMYSGVEDEDLRIEEIQKMKYLEQCIKETLRVFPPVPFILRKATKTFHINDHFTIQENSHVIIPIAMVHRNPSIYSDALRWNPDNFTKENVQRRHKYSFLAFSGGVRDCIGKKYALLAIQVIIARILKNYRLDTDFTMDDLKIRLEIVIRSENGYKIKLYSRKNKNHVL